MSNRKQMSEKELWEGEVDEQSFVEMIFNTKKASSLEKITE